MPKELTNAQTETLEQLVARLQGKGAKVQIINTRETETFELTKAELLAACAKNPNHAHADIYVKGVAGLPSGAKVVIDKIDLEALLENREVILVPEQTTEIAADGSEVTFLTERKQFA